MKTHVLLGAALLLAGLNLFGQDSTATSETEEAQVEESPSFIYIHWNSNHYKYYRGDSPELYKISMDSELAISGVEEEKLEIGTFLDSLNQFTEKESIKITFYTHNGEETDTHFRLADSKGVTECMRGDYDDTSLREFLYLSRNNSKSRSNLDEDIFKNDSLFKVSITTVETEFTARMREIEGQTFEDEVGRFKMLSNTATVHIDAQSGTKEVEITQLRLRIVEGFVVEILAESDDFQQFHMKFKEAKDIFNFHVYIHDIKLHNVNGDESYIELNEILYFRPEEFIGYRPDNAIVILNKKDEIFIIKQTYTINSIIDARIYSDMRGLLGNAPNGLVNIELKSPIPLNAKNSGRVLWIPYVSPSLRYSRFDGDQTKLILENQEIPSGLNFLQQSKLSAGLDLGIFRTLRNTGRYEIGLEANFFYNNTDLYDTTETIIEPDYNTIFSGLTINNKINLNRRFWVDVDVKYGYLWKMGSTEITNFTNNITMWGIRAELSYQPNPNSKDGIYLAFGAYDDVTNPNGDYTFIQLGYQVSLSRAISSMNSSPTPTAEDMELYTPLAP